MLCSLICRRRIKGHGIDFGWSMTQKISAILFDMDGVLIESVDSKTEAFRQLFEEYSDKISALWGSICST